jgi:hypothetical protein
MADVQVNQTAPGKSGGSNWVWAVIVVVLLAVIGWFAIGQPYLFQEKSSVNVNQPATST